MASLEKEINQKDFKSEHQKALVNIIFTSSWISGQMNSLLKPYNISMQQFNLLRILKGASPEAISMKTLSERMIDKNSNASRLVEKLRKKDLVDRTMSAEDRRKVNVIITPKGVEVLGEASNTIETVMLGKMETISEEQAKHLNLTLDQLRNE